MPRKSKLIGEKYLKVWDVLEFLVFCFIKVLQYLTNALLTTVSYVVDLGKAILHKVRFQDFLQKISCGLCLSLSQF